MFESSRKQSFKQFISNCKCCFKDYFESPCWELCGGRRHDVSQCLRYAIQRIHNFMPNMVYLIEVPNHKWVRRQFWQDMFNHECISEIKEQTFRVFNKYSFGVLMQNFGQKNSVLTLPQNA